MADKIHEARRVSSTTYVVRYERLGGFEDKFVTEGTPAYDELMRWRDEGGEIADDPSMVT